MKRLPDSLIALALATALAPALVSCGGGGSGGSASGGVGGTGTLSVLVTDAPIDPELVTSATIEVDTITIKKDGHGHGHGHDSNWITIYEGKPIEFDLLDLRNGLTMQLAEADLPAGTYKEIRMGISSATLVLVNGNTYSTDEGNLIAPGGMHSELKIKIKPKLEVHEDVDCAVLFDFDLSHSFKPMPGNDPLNATTYKLSPKLRAANLTECAEISGTVVRDGDDGEEAVGMATVYVLLPDETNLDAAVATTISEADGTWTVLGLEFGEYDLAAVKDAEMGRVNGVEVDGGHHTPHVEISIAAP